ncbi:MAG TPA: hypothetical protein VEH00_04760 [Steroidobacteraceae bacterium]|nr:hypothetical protein [Steroidobacteraceae bacterium]
MRTVLMLFAALVFSAAQAQQSSSTAPAGKPPAAVPSPDQLEPAVDTTATTTPDAAPARAAASAGRLTPKGDKAPASASAAAPKSADAAGDATQPARTGARGAKGADRVELETTEITGNRELPKVLYIVPWKRSDLGDLVGKPANSLLDEVLEPIDRDVFLRENRYYDAVKPDVPRPKAGAVPGSGDKP